MTAAEPFESDSAIVYDIAAQARAIGSHNGSEEDGHGHYPDIPWPESPSASANENPPAALRDLQARISDDERPHDEPKLVDLIACARTPAPPRNWVVAQLIPRGANVLFSSNGGLGKSKLMLLLAVCVTAGISFFGLEVAQGRVVFLSCEDDATETHRCLQQICRALDINLEKLLHCLFIYDATGRDAALYSRRTGVSVDGKVMLTAAPDATPMFDWLQEKVQSIGADLVILDSLSDTNDASEIDRAQVRRYYTLCLSLFAEGKRGTVVHIGHVDKYTARAGNGLGQSYSGSTAHNNSVRQRIALSFASDREPGSTQEDDGRRLLTVEKSNYSRAGFTLALRFDPELGVFVRDADEVTGGMVGHIRDTAERRELLKLLLACERNGVDVQTPQRANQNAMAILGSMAGFPKALKVGKTGRDRLWSHLRKLQLDGLIEEEPYRTAANHKSARWKVNASGRNEATSQ